MNKNIKNLGTDTLLYGISTIVPRLLNWGLMPIYVRILTETENGIYSNIYSYVAILLVFLTCGMETSFFRFAYKRKNSEDSVYSTSLIFILVLSCLFIFICFAFSSILSRRLGYGNHSDYIIIMSIVVAVDAFTSIPFCFLRLKRKAQKFAVIKSVVVFVIVLSNLFFLLICPILHREYPMLVVWFYSDDYGIGYVFVSNLIGAVVSLFLLFPYYKSSFTGFNFKLLKEMLSYSVPLMFVGIIGILNQNIDKIIYPLFFENKVEAFHRLGIYAACFKLAIVMAIYTQAFRFALEPYFFSAKNDLDKSFYSIVLKYFVISSLIIFLAMVFYIDLFKFILTENYFEGLSIVPIVMIGYISFGVYFNLSFWYKLTDRTHYGILFSIVGLMITILINIIFIPHYGYMACAYATLFSNFVMMLLSYKVGQKYFPINYDVKSISFYCIIALFLYLISTYIHIESLILRLVFRSILFFLFLFLLRRELPFKKILCKFLKMLR